VNEERQTANIIWRFYIPQLAMIAGLPKCGTRWRVWFFIFEEGLRMHGRKILSFIAAFQFSMIPCYGLKAQELRVANVRFEQIGETIIVLYDLDGRIGKKYNISLSLSDNFGKTFNIEPKTVSGDVGKNIEPGIGKKITWYMKTDFPEGLNGEGFVFAVDAELQKGGKKWPYIVGAGVVGGVVYFIAGGKKKSEPSKTGSIVIDVPGDF